ncbi:MAG TPA: hypothetical protein VNW97_08800 [Candidatus Saccharimonadales bacterium]|jgi:hypothetical protein|nr:hypothetical protein [Candidatus Saccharimonadales bacterium]
MTFSSQEDAKTFLVNKVTFEADFKGMHLSFIEQRMLDLDLSDPASAAGIPLGLLRDRSQEFEAKIAGLLRSAYTRASEDPKEQQRIEQAVQKLTGGSYYIVVPASTALQPQPGGIGFFLLIVISLAMAGAAIAWAVLRGR